MTRSLFILLILIASGLPAQTASVVSIGQGCGGAAYSYQPSLYATLPTLGSPMQVWGTGLPLVTSGALFAGSPANDLVSAGSPPFSVPCTVYLDLATIQVVAPIAGDYSGSWALQPIQIPSDPSLAGVSISVQAGFAGPMLIMTNGLLINLGN